MADSVVLTPEEQRRLKPLFGQYDLEGSSIVLGDRIRPLLEKSGLPPAQLGQIWQLVDTENCGFLDFPAFVKCMRLIAHAQQGLALSPRMANIPSGMPDFSRQPVAASATTTGTAPAPASASATGESPLPPPSRIPMASLSTGGSTFSANGETRIPPLTTADKNRYGVLFDKSVPAGATFVDGGVARDIFLKARLPQETLGKVWSLVDVEGRGQLTKNEFAVAMHLIQSLINKHMPNLPSALPASWSPWLGTHGSALATHATAHSTGAHAPPPAPVGRARTGTVQSPTVQSPRLQSPTVRSPSVQSPQATATTPLNGQPVSIDIGPAERAQYDAIFDSLDTGRTGILGPNQAVPLLTKSKLPEDVLARVWDLADTQSRGQLDRGDFALAMHFVKAKLNGGELPETVSPGAGAAPAQAPAQTSQAAAPAQAQTQAPVQAPVQSPVHSGQQERTGSLSDLVSLDSAVYRPLEPAKPRRAQTDIDDKRFVPTTSFGQQLLQRQQLRNQPTPQAQPAQPSQAQQPPQPAQPAQPAQATQAPQPAQPAQPIQSKEAVGVGSSTASTAATSADVQALQSQVTSVKAQQAQSNAELATVLKEKADLEAKLAELRRTYDSGTQQVHETQQQIKQAREDVKQLEKDIALRTSGLDAIKTQHKQESATREALLARKAELEAQHASSQTEIDAMSHEIEEFRAQHRGHEQTIGEHEALLQRLQQEIETSRWHRQQAEEEARKHYERSLQLKQQAESQKQEHARAAEEARQAQEHAQQQAHSAQQAHTQQSHNAQQAHNASSNAGPTNISFAQTGPAPGPTPGSASGGGVRDAGSPFPTGAPLGALGGLAAAGTTAASSIGVDSLGSSADFGTADTPRTSPPTSEANFLARPPSATSSVVNNPPQSVRDLGSEPSELQSPEFPPSEPAVPSETTAVPSTESFVPVDSSDDEGPANAVPQRFYSPKGGPSEPSEAVPPMPGAFPKEFEEPLPPAPADASTEPTSRDVTESVSTEQPTVPTSTLPTSTLPTSTLPTSRDEPPSYDQRDATGPSGFEPAYGHQPSATDGATDGAPFTFPPGVQAADDFDEFDDLEEAKEDDTDEFNTSSQQMQPAPASGPDEWQQLFASTGPAQSSAQPDSFWYSVGQPTANATSESREVAELTSMGFTDEEAKAALELHGHNLSEATNYLLDRMQ